MIQLRKLTPNVYYDHSRDFQFIGRLYDMVLNSVKTNTDMIYSLPLSEDSDTKLLDLMTMTFGFKSKHNYNIQQLKSLCACFAKVIRNKGNIKSIQDACNALLGAEGIKETVHIKIDPENPTSIKLYAPEELSDMNLLKDLLNYILPAGMTYQIVKILKTTMQTSTEVMISSSVKRNMRHGQETAHIIKVALNGDSGIPINKPYNEPAAFLNTTVVASMPESTDQIKTTD